MKLHALKPAPRDREGGTIMHLLLPVSVGSTNFNDAIDFKW